MYNTSINVQYSNDTEYQEMFNQVFTPFRVPNVCNAQKLTPVSFKNAHDVGVLNEKRCNTNDYNDEIVKKTLDEIYELTKDNPLFKKLYETYAGKFLSTDCEIGLAVAFSYSYFQDFHPFLCEFLDGKGNVSREINQDNKHYKKIIG
jgi:hypothetical protein